MCSTTGNVIGQMDLPGFAAELDHDPRRPLKEPWPKLLDWCERELEARGWHKDVAGDENFNSGVRAMALSEANNLGILVGGVPGIGKTKYLEAVTAHRATKIFRLKDVIQAGWLNRYDYPEYFVEWLKQDIFIDDLGAETTVNHYGTIFEPAIDFIFSFQLRSKRRIFISTNLTGKQLVDRYNWRMDCLKEFTIPLDFKGEGLRKWKRI